MDNTATAEPTDTERPPSALPLPSILTDPYPTVHARFCRITRTKDGHKHSIEVQIRCRLTDLDERTGKTQYYLRLDKSLGCFRCIGWDGTNWRLANMYYSLGEVVEFELL